MRSSQVAAEKARPAAPAKASLPGGPILMAMTVLIVLLLSKNAYTAAFTSYYTFYLIERFGVTVQASQVLLFLYLVVGAIGVVIGGMVGDRVGRHRVIWISILGSLPFALLLPHVDLFWTAVLSVVISLIMSSAFASILIYAIDLVPHRVGLIGGLFYGLAFGLGGPGGGGPRPARRPDRHHRRVQALRLAAGARIADVPAPSRPRRRADGQAVRRPPA